MDRDLGEGLQVRACRGDSLLVTARLNSRSHPLIAGAVGVGEGLGLFGPCLVLR